ncbi:hypothetical protein FRB91_011466 [Serendipita sp. 411]|nr:hypothetical protein FRC16_001599 [Serendipita sp. 398]KAG8828297.1 hypothetical protein FRC19_008413 [Serendipita sp. 401]KAG8839527.1 hypothetical protein FRC18_010306 [Serendipita sp. 400]KAG8857371.1 hypothetical protein FRB91_011466 [Serendipita sp. 411]KAG9058789.1 hypothetical protein FS842_003578 [Serendipita sp. 407]
MPLPPGFNVSHQRQVMGAAGGSSGSTSPPLGGSLTGMIGSGGGWIAQSPVEILVQRACDPSLSEPPYHIHVELAELINNKKANTPREAAMATVRMVNHRNPHVSILALSLLDSLVQSCGYPVHLQVATKEFLNELVRRFPERPPPFPGPVMQRILELIHSWKEGICTQSRWKEDLGNIRDMHRLLSFKGYRFRDLPRNNTTNNISNVESLKSPEELENEDREAQSAKLQELLRRGTPKDLAAAQELMKILAGAEPEAKPDYKAQTLKELNKVEAKVILLNEMLDNVDKERGEQFAPGDVYDQVSTSIAAALPKIQGWISDAEAHDPDSLSAFLQINDQINNVMARYEAFKKGDYAAAANPVPPELAALPAKESLIDLMGDETAETAAPATTGNATDDLADLFSNPGTNIVGTTAQANRPSNADIMSMFSTPASNMVQPRPTPVGGYSSFQSGIVPGTQPQYQPFQLSQAQGSQPPMQMSGYPAPMGGGQIMLPGTPQSQLKGLSNSRTGTPLGSRVTSTASSSTNTASPQPPAAPASTTNQKDPFADLVGLF